MTSSRPSARPRKIHPALLWPGLALLFLGLGLVWTHPLWRHWGQAIAYNHAPLPGYQLYPLMPGDHLQFLYWCWLMADNLLGSSALFHNPYEFNTFLSPGYVGDAFFPFSLLYVLLKPLGPAQAYNSLTLLSYVLAGMCAWALAREVLAGARGTNTAWAALAPALVLALMPFRAAQALSGHLYGFIAFLLPLMLFCLERGWRTESSRRSSRLWGLGAGLAYFLGAYMEAHLAYYAALLLGLYVPARLILLGRREDHPPQGGPPPGQAQALWPLAAGLGLAVMTLLRLGRQPGSGLEGLPLAQALLLYPLLALLAWLVLSWLAWSLTSLSLGQARRAVGRGLAPLALAPLYALQFWLDIPHLGTLLLLALAAGGAWLGLPGLWRARRRPGLGWRELDPLWGLGLGLALGTARLLFVKSRDFEASIAHAGRGLGEVLLFAPRWEDLFTPQASHAERLVYLGWPLLALLALALVLLAWGRGVGSRPQAALASLWAALGGLACLLCLGPTLEGLPLYQLLYRWLPFFNFPRVPGRLILPAAVLLSLAAAWALAQVLEMARPRRGRWLGAAGGLLAAGLLAWSYMPAGGIGLCALPPAGGLEREIAARLAQAPAEQRRVLALPLWPGDSHQSSVYEHLITRTGQPMVNGYTPLTRRAYVEQVFQPLAPLNLGSLEPPGLAALARLQAGLLAFHDQDQVYTAKVSPFPPALARERLAASGMFKPLGQHGDVFLYQPIPEAGPPAPVDGVTSPVTSAWEAFALPRQTGRLVEDKNASGWGLLFRDQEDPAGPGEKYLAGNVALASPGRDQPGFLAYGPFKGYPPGRYTARFRLKRGAGGMPGRVEVAADKGSRILAAAELGQERLPADGAWREVELEFALERVTPLEFRAWYSGQAELALNTVLVSFAGENRWQRFFPAARLWRQAGELVLDERVPGGLASLAKAGQTPPLYLMHGPRQSLDPGRYVASFRLAAQGENPAGAELAELVVASDLGRLPLASALARGADLGPEYRELRVPFEVERRCEVDLRVLYKGGGSLRLAGASLEPGE